jgi:hypothetical protein
MRLGVQGDNQTSIDLSAPWRPVDGTGRSVRTCENAGEHLHLRQVQVSSGGLARARASALASGAGFNRPCCNAVSRRRGWEVGARLPARLTGRCFVAGSIDTCTCVRCKCRPAGWHEHAHLHLRQAPVSIDVAVPWRPVDGAGRSVRWRVAIRVVRGSAL